MLYELLVHIQGQRNIMVYVKYLYSKFCIILHVSICYYFKYGNKSMYCIFLTYNIHRVYRGRMLANIQTTGESGEITDTMVGSCKS